jgi:hypothetical protein
MSAKEVTISGLRTSFPKWAWRAERNGMGWEYEGTFGARTVRIIARSELLTYGDDNSFRTVWLAHEAGKTDSFFVWALAERSAS